MQPALDQVHGLNDFETSSCTIFQPSVHSALEEESAIFPCVQKIQPDSRAAFEQNKAMKEIKI